MLMWSVMAIKVPGPKPIPPAALVTTTPSHQSAFITRTGKVTTSSGFPS